ncbi:MAG: SPOR domain-containing protein [Ignavibacteriaceae bacterium]
MTKAELIRKLAKKAGIPDSEAKVFFEIFLRKASEILKLGEAIKLKNFGYFQFKRGMIKNIHSTASSVNNLAYADLMVFTSLNETEEGEENLIFNIPSLRDEEFHYVDLFFSLSIGKPLIPLKGVAGAEFFIPPTGIELKKLINSKVDKLLFDAEIIDKHVKGSEFLLIDVEKSNLEQFEFNWESVYSENLEGSSGNKIPSMQNYSAGNSGLEHVDWDFGEDLSKQIEEEVLLDTSKDSENISNYELDDSAGIEWNFGIPIPEGGVILNAEFEKVDSLRTTLSSGLLDDFSGNKKINDEDSASNGIEERIQEELNDFHPIKSITSELNEPPAGMGITKSELNLSWNFGNTNPEMTYQNNLEIKNDNKLSNLNNEKIHKNELSGEMDKDNSSKKGEILKNEKDTQAPPDSDLFPQNERSKITQDKDQKVTKRSSVVFIVALTVILFVGFLLFALLNKFNFISILKSNKNVTTSEKIYSHPVIIKRDYQVPVNYPYSKNNLPPGLTSQGIDPEALNNQQAQISSQSMANKNSLSTLLNSSKQNVNSDQTTSAVKKQDKLKDNIVSLAGNYSIQVSSWKSKTSAIKEIEQFKRKGLTATLEKVDLSGRGIWYRVMVGGFKSAADAKRFLTKYK